MRAYDIIRKKRDGETLTGAEINYLIQGYTQGKVPDYQMAAWAMAVCCQGMDIGETVNLTKAMVASGETMDLSSIPGIKVDKHSTGGVGDTTTLVLAPLIAAAGGRMAKMSGRGLGHTGGTLDKFEAIPGFRVALTQPEFLATIQSVGAAVVGQTGNLVPADKHLYALRDVTATVESIPLIASSVMSKKLAAGADAIVLDVKAGPGAFMKDIDEAFALAHLLVEIGKTMGRATVALVTSMQQPLGRAVGNALEVKEAVEVLRGTGPADLQELCLVLGSHLMVLSELAQTEAEARTRLAQLLRSGAALTKFKEIVKAQKGNPAALEDASLLPQAQTILPIPSPQAGYVQAIQAEAIGLASTLLGAGRETKADTVDLGVGVVLHKKVGEAVDRGEPLAFLHVNQSDRLAGAREKVEMAFKVGPALIDAPPLVYGVVT